MFALWLGNSYLIKVYDNFLPDYFADDLENLHTSDRFGWYLNPSTIELPEKDGWKKFDDDGTISWEMNGIKQSFLDKRTVNSPQFTHVFYIQESGSISDHTSKVENVLKYIDTNTKELYVDRIKSNLNVNLTDYKEENYQPPHKDSPLEIFQSLLYYVNDSDGDTYFFDENLNIIDVVSPKKNRAIVFPSNMIHAGSNPIKNGVRMVINFVFSEKKIKLVTEEDIK